MQLKKISDDESVAYNFTAYDSADAHQKLFGFIISTFKASSDMTVKKQSLNKTVYINNETEFLITVENTGSLDLFNVTVTEDKHEGLEYKTFKDPSNKWSFDGNSKWTYADALPAGESASFTVVFTAVKAGNFTNYVIAKSNGTDEVTANNTTQVFAPDLKVEKITVTPVVKVGEEVVFTIKVTNTGDCDLGDVKVVENPPSGFTYQGISGGGWKAENDNTFTYGSVLKAGDSVSFDVTYLTSVNGTFINIVTAGSNVTESTSAENNTTVIAPKLSVSKVAATPEVIAGSEVQFTINVTNTGDCDIDDVRVVEKAPSQFKYLTMSGEGWSTEDGETFTYSNVLTPGRSVVFDVIYLTSQTGEFKNIVCVCSNLTENETANDTVKVLKAEMEVNKVADDDIVYIGDDTSFTITVKNTGECDLTEVFVEENIPEGLTYKDYQNGTGNWIKKDNRFHLSGNLTVGENVTLIIEVTTSKTGNFTNRITAGSDESENQSSQATVEVLKPEIKAVKTADEKTVYAGNEASFTITVRNTGNCDLTEVAVTENIPEGLTYADYANGTGKWNKKDDRFYLADTLKAGENVTLIIKVLTAESGNFTNCVVVGSKESENDSSNDTITVYKPGLKVEEVANDKSVNVGDETSFTITVINTGDCELTGVFVVDKLDEGLTYSGYSNGTGNWTKEGDKFYLDTGLEAGENVTLIVMATVNEEGNFTNSVSAGSDQTSNESANATVDVLEKEEDSTESDVGEDVGRYDDAEDVTVESEQVNVKTDGKATGNQLMLLLLALSLIGQPIFRRFKK